VRRRSPYEAPETDDRRHVSRFRDALRSHRDLEGARHMDHLELLVRDPLLAHRLRGSGQEAIGYEIMEARHHDRNPH
jgi:hypothetical protein